MAASITVRTERGEEPLDLEEFEDRVARGEIAPQCPTQFPAVTGEAWVPAGTLEIFQRRYSPRELRFSRAFRFGGVPKVTLALTGINVAWYAAMQAWPRGTPDDTLVAYGAKAGPLILDLGQFWRLLTANFVHRDLLHIGMNLFVLFNFAGALENAFRPLDMVLIFLASALGTTILSALVTDPVSVGASGVAYGALGAAVVFGLKYRALLPERYRRVLGGAVVPTVLVFLFLGFTSTGVDNWGHLGGLLAGSAVTLALKPRLLSGRPSPRRLFWSRWVPILGTLVLLALLGPLTRPFLPLMVPRVDEELGVAARVPLDWDSVPGRWGGHAYTNGIVGYGEARFTVAGELEDDAPDLAATMDELIQRDLWEPEADEGLRVESLPPAHTVVLGAGELRGIERDGTFRQAGAELRLRALVLARGRMLYVVETIASLDQPRYQPLLDRIIDSLTAVEPTFLREARARRLLLPGSETTASELDDAVGTLRVPDPATVE